jgi:hypothetical protein
MILQADISHFWDSNSDAEFSGCNPSAITGVSGHRCLPLLVETILQFWDLHVKHP